MGFIDNSWFRPRIPRPRPGSGFITRPRPRPTMPGWIGGSVGGRIAACKTKCSQKAAMIRFPNQVAKNLWMRGCVSKCLGRPRPSTGGFISGWGMGVMSSKKYIACKRKAKRLAARMRFTSQEARLNWIKRYMEKCMNSSSLPSGLGNLCNTSFVDRIASYDCATLRKLLRRFSASLERMQNTASGSTIWNSPFMKRAVKRLRTKITLISRMIDKKCGTAPSSGGTMAPMPTHTAAFSGNPNAGFVPNPNQPPYLMTSHHLNT